MLSSQDASESGPYTETASFLRLRLCREKVRVHCDNAIMFTTLEGVD